MRRVAYEAELVELEVEFELDAVPDLCSVRESVR